MQGIERVEVTSAALLSLLQAEQDAEWETLPLERHDPGKHNQKTHGDWAHPGSTPSSSKSGSSSSSSSSPSSSSNASSPAQHMSATLASKASFYQGLASHPVSKTWTAQDQQLAAQMAKDFQAISDGLKSGKDVTSLVADMTKAAQSLHDAAPTHMTQARLDVMTGMQKRITHALSQHAASSSSSAGSSSHGGTSGSSSSTSGHGSSSSGGSSSGHSSSSHHGTSSSGHAGSSGSSSHHSGSSGHSSTSSSHHSAGSSHHSGSSTSGSSHHSGSSGTSGSGHSSSGSSHQSGASSSHGSSHSSHGSSSGHSSSGGSGHSSGGSSSHHSGSSHGSSSSKGTGSGSSGSGSGKSGSGSSSSGSSSSASSPQAQHMSSILADKASFYSDLASKAVSKNWTQQDQQIASQLAQDMQSISDGLKSGKDVSAQIADMVKSAQALHDASPSHMTETKLDVMTGLQKRIGHTLSAPTGQQARMLDGLDALERRDYSQAERDQMDDSDFAGPHESYQIKTQQDVYNAARLIGHADDPDEVKARIKAIAKRKGFNLPDSWQNEEDSSKERAMGKGNHAPFTGTHTHAHPAFGAQGDDEMHSHEHTHDNDADHGHEHSDDAPQDRSVSAMTSQDFSLYLPITRTDATQRRVFGQATIEQPDAYGTIFGFYPEAWQKWRGNIREQHDPKKAVGKALEVLSDEQRRAIDVDLKVSRGAQDTWLKVEDGVLTGLSASIIPDEEYGNDIRKWPKKEYNGKQYPYLPRYSVVELSLVDNPATPGCNIQIVRSQGGASLATDVLDFTEESERAPETEVKPLERAGARLSGATRDALHDSIKHTLHAASSLMQNCGCDTCQQAGKALDPDGDGDIDLGGYDDTDGDAGQMDRSADDFMAAKMQERMVSALERSLAPVYSRQQQFLARLAQTNTDYSHIHEQLSTLTATVERLASNPTNFERVLADLSAVKVEVEKIAAQPMPGGPILNGARPAEKTLATTPQNYTPNAGGYADVQAGLRQMQQSGELDTQMKQLAAAALTLRGQMQSR